MVLHFCKQRRPETMIPWGFEDSLPPVGSFMLCELAPHVLVFLFYKLGAVKVPPFQADWEDLVI